MKLDETHDPALRSWVASANAPDGDFPIQNLPYAVFRQRGDNAPPRVGVAIGAEILDVGAVGDLMDGVAAGAAAACASPHLNVLMERGPEAWAALRLELSRLLRTGSTERSTAVETHLTPVDAAELLLPVRIGNFTDFYASIFHATNAGRLFRPDNPLLPNYKYVPVAYHSRASSVRVSGVAVRRPRGQTKRPDEAPAYRASRNLDYELELGFYIGTPSALGHPVPIADASDHVFGFCLLNDWSARDIQAWESQPLGPFLAKNFATTVSPFVVTAAALAPYHTRAFERPQSDPAPLPHLTAAQDQESGGLDIVMEAFLLTAKMRGAGAAPFRLSRGTFADIYWTVAQMVAPHASNGCNLEAGDLMGSGTVSGPDRASWASLLELTQRGKEPIALPNGETRFYLEDGDEIIFRGHCARAGFARLGFGECRAVIAPAVAA
jgi:fumarylacetoacetase